MPAGGRVGGSGVVETGPGKAQCTLMRTSTSEGTGQAGSRARSLVMDEGSKESQM